MLSEIRSRNDEVIVADGRSNIGSEEQEYIIYLETDITVKAYTLKEAERFAKEFIKALYEHYSGVGRRVNIDETRVITSEKKIWHPQNKKRGKTS